MSRKPTKGYFVRGQFVAEGSELDLELKREMKGRLETSRTDQKNASDALQELGESLLTLRTERINRLGLPEKLVDAVAEAKRNTNFEGKRRQMQFIGKLMRKLEEAPLEAVRAALSEQHNGSAHDNLVLHQSEVWRDRLLAQEDAFGEWVGQFPATDTQQLRSLVRQARKDSEKPTPPGEAPRHGKAFREIFLLVRSQLQEQPQHQDPHQPQGASDGN